MSVWFLLIFFLNIVGPALGVLSVNRVIPRTPKDGDIGLIFDINLINTANEEKELLEYRIRPEKECCVNLTDTTITFNGGKIIGGSFGHIEPGAMQTISVIWPTTAIFNRVGRCSAIISSTNVKNIQKEFVQQLPFDTRYIKLDSAGTTFRRRKEYIECSNWDMDFMNNCTPVNCEEKYMGRRNYYNVTSKLCEPAPKCLGENEIYDIYANECIDPSKLMNPADIENIRKGKYENNNLELKTPQQLAQHIETRNANQEYVPVLAHHENETSIWPALIGGASLLFATIVIYTTACFFIFLLVNWLSKASVNSKPPQTIILNRS